MITQFAIGFMSGILIGVAVFSHPFSRAVLSGAITVDGVDGYLSSVTYLPTEMAKFIVFWMGLIAGIVGAGVVGHARG
jgi:hypothetical protein